MKQRTHLVMDRFLRLKEQKKAKTLLLFLEEDNTQPTDLQLAIVYLYLVIGSQESYFETIAEELALAANTGFITKLQEHLNQLNNVETLSHLFTVISDEYLKQTHSNNQLGFILKIDEIAVKHARSEEHTSELQSRPHLVCRLLLEKKKKKNK